MATYDITTSAPGSLKTGDILNCPYSGSVKSITLPAGVYKLECWGAQGGYRSSTTYGGRGGYSYGTITLKNPRKIYLYAGGSGNTGKTAGGFNGGGTRGTYNGGGGASDIRLGADSLYARVIVAGGGGSDGASSKYGGAGGGTSGVSATENYGSGGGGGTQTSGGSGGSSNSGTFGIGGAGLTRSNGYGGAGGGGWYGGGGAYPDGSGDDDRGGGGGSGYVYTSSTASSYPSGCMLTSDDYLASAATVAGNTSFTDYNGANTTGRLGDGACRITVIEAKSFSTNMGDETLRYIQLGEESIGGMFVGDEQVFAGSKLLNVRLNVYAEGAYASNITNLNATYEEGVIRVTCPTSTTSVPCYFRLAGYVGTIRDNVAGTSGYCTLVDLPSSASKYDVIFSCTEAPSSSYIYVNIIVQPTVPNPNNANTYKITYRTTFGTNNLPVKLSTEDFTRYIGDVGNWYGFPDIALKGVPAGVKVTVGPNSWFRPDRIFAADGTTVLPATEITANSVYEFAMPEGDVVVHLTGMGCFVAGTKVLMADRTYKNIEDIVIGDKVACYNAKEQKNDISEVTQTFINSNTSFVTLTLDSEESFTCTIEHNIYSVDRSCYVPANKLNIGEVLQTHKGTCVIKNIEIIANTEPTTVYNFTVKDEHNYFVGGGAVAECTMCPSPQCSILVHNAIS